MHCGIAQIHIYVCVLMQTLFQRETFKVTTHGNSKKSHLLLGVKSYGFLAVHN